MAVSIVETQSISQPSANSRSLTFDSSWTPQANDLVVFWCGSDQLITQINVPAGWVNPLGGGTFVTTDQHCACVVYHWVTSAEAAAVTRTYTATNLFSPSRAGVAAGVVLRGVDATTPIDSVSSTFSSADTATPHVLPGLTGSNLSTNSLVLSGVYPDGNESYTTPSGWTAQISQVLAVGRNVWVGSRDTLTTAGSNISDTNITPSVGDEYASITLAFTAAGSVAVQPTPATLTLSGSVPSIVPAHTVQPLPATLTLSGSTPTIGRPFSMSLGVGQSELPWGLGGTATSTDVARICQETASLGASSIRMSALWLQIDPNRNHKYQWANLDRAIAFAESAGLQILLIVEPRRSVLPIGVSATLAMAQDYGLLCGAIAQRYTGRIRWYEIGNEVNNLAFFGAPKTPAKYLNFLSEAYQNIMAADPAATVLAGALQAVGTGWPTLHPVEWVRAFYDSNPQEWFHGLSMHPYSTDGNFNPVTPTLGNEFAFKNIDAIRQIMDDNGDTGKQIFCTEWGYDSMRSLDGTSTTDAELEAEQARNIEAHWEILKTYARAGIIYPTTWVFMYRDWEQANKKPQNHFGFTHFDYTPKAAFNTVRSLAGPRNIDAAPTSVTVTGWDADVEVYIDPTIKKPSPAVVTATGWAAVIGRPITPTTGAVTVTGWPPLIGKVTDVQYVSTGSGDRDTTLDDDITLSWTHTVSGGSLLLVGLTVSHENSKAWELYDILSVTSNIDGAFTRRASRHIANWGNKEGSVHIFTLTAPAAGTHTITARVKNDDGGVTTFTAVAGNSVLYAGASGPGAVAANGSSAGGNTPTVTDSSTVGNMVAGVFASATDMTGGFTGTVRYTTGSTVGGNGDFILIGDKPGATSVNMTASGLKIYGGLLIDLVKGAPIVEDTAPPPPPPPPPPVVTRPAGLTETFIYAAATTGVSRSVLDFGATPNNSSNDDKAAIKNAIAACSAGDEVYFPNGVYTIKGSSGITLKKGVNLRGESRDGAIISTSFSASTSSVLYIPTGASDITISNLSIIKGSGSTYDSAIRVSDENLKATTPSVERVIVRNVVIKHHKRFGVFMNNTKHMLVDSCIIRDASALDGGGQGYGIMWNCPSCHNNWARNNIIGPVIRHGLLCVDLAHHNLLGGTLEDGTPCGNEVVGAVSDAVDMHGELEYSNEISYNLIHDNVRNGTNQSPNGAGIGIGEPPTDKTLGGSGHDKSGPYNWIHHNEIYGCPQGIRVMNQSNYTYIEDNNIHGNDDGILIDQQDGYASTGVDHPYVLRNTITGNGRGLVMIDTVTNADVEDNIITGNTGDGIYGDANTTDYLITGNTVSGNGTNVSLGSTQGVYTP